jgi:hypothetical protein
VKKVIDKRKTVAVDPELHNVVREAASNVSQMLFSHGMHESFVTKMHASDGLPNGWIASYRDRSQFTSHTTFWVNPYIDLYLVNLERVITDSILHEYGHVIYEWGVKRDPILLNMIIQRYITEEYFAESFIQVLKSDGFINNANDITKRFIESAFGK